MLHMAYTLLEIGSKDVFIFLHTDKQPSRAEWDDIIKAQVEYTTAHNGDFSRYRVLAITDGGGPDASMRKQLTNVWAGASIKACVVTESVMARGIVTALSWFNPGQRAFSPREIHAAATHLDLRAELPGVLAAFAKMQQEVYPVACLRQAQVTTQAAAHDATKQASRV